MKDTKRLTYRLMTDEDFPFYYELNSSHEVMKYAYADRFESEYEARLAFDEILNEQNDEKEGSKFIVIDKNTGSKIGIVDYDVLMLHEKGGICEIGYFILPKYWGNGYAVEMGNGIIKYLFDNYNVHKITASCHTDNKASEGIMKKLGMTKEGINRKGRYKDKKWVDEIRYGLLKGEFRS